MQKSNYNLYVPIKNGNTLVFNTISQGILEMEEEYINKLDQPNKLSDDEIKLLCGYGILTI